MGGPAHPLGVNIVTQTTPATQRQSNPQNATANERYYYASQWRLMWWRFQKHRLAMASGVVIILLYLLATFAECIAPYDPQAFSRLHAYVPPQTIRLIDHEGRLRLPFVYGLARERDPETRRLSYVEDTSKTYGVHFFVQGDAYKFWGLIPSNIHLFGLAPEDRGVTGGTLYLLGTDRLGRDMLSRIVYGARVSLSIGLVGVLISFVLGIVIGGISGYYGGVVDSFIQRVIEFLRSVPTIPLWMGLAAALPVNWPPLTVYFVITLLLSVIGWTGLARVVRGRFLSLRQEEFVLAARFSGASERRIIFRHMVPSFASHIIASLTLAIPDMILAETSLSFLGLGLRPPVISWGVLLQEAQNLQTIALYPWLLVPGLFVIVTILSFNFLGDGLRDAADPYSKH